jgi:hypothetical protein
MWLVQASIDNIGEQCILWLPKSRNRMTVPIQSLVVGTCSYFGADSATKKKHFHFPRLSMAIGLTFTDHIYNQILDPGSGSHLLFGNCPCHLVPPTLSHLSQRVSSPIYTSMVLMHNRVVITLSLFNTEYHTITLVLT